MSEEGLAELQTSANSVVGREPGLAWKRLVLDTSSIHCLHIVYTLSNKWTKGTFCPLISLLLVYVKQERSTRPATNTALIRRPLSENIPQFSPGRHSPMRVEQKSTIKRRKRFAKMRICSSFNKI